MRLCKWERISKIYTDKLLNLALFIPKWTHVYGVGNGIYGGARLNKFSYFYVEQKYVNLSHIIIMLNLR